MQAFNAVLIPPGPHCLEQMSYSEIRLGLGKTVSATTLLYPILTMHHQFQHCGVDWSIHATCSTFMGHSRFSEKRCVQTLFSHPLQVELSHSSVDRTNQLNQHNDLQIQTYNLELLGGSVHLHHCQNLLPSSSILSARQSRKAAF